MNILHINSYYKSSNLYLHLHKELESMSLNQIIYVPSDNTKNIQSIENINFDNRIIHSKCFDKKDRFIYFIKIKKIFDDIVKKVKIQEIDLIHAHSMFINGGVAYLLKKAFNVKYITAVRSTDVNYFMKWGFFLKKWYINILLEAERIIFISPSYQKKTIETYIPRKYKKIILNKSQVIQNGIENYWHENRALKAKKISNQQITLIYVGSFIKRKNILKIIDSINILQKENISTKLILVGSGKLFSKVKKHIRKLDDYIIAGQIKEKNKIKELLNQSNIFMMPSKCETFGLVYIEAMSQGLPVIYSKGEGIDGYFDDGAIGYRVNPDNIKEIADKVRCILNRYDNMSKNCIEKSKLFNWEDISYSYFRLYSEIMNSSK